MGGGTGAGGGIGATTVVTGAGTGLTTTFLSSFRRRPLLTMAVSSSLSIPRTLPAETEVADKAADATRRAKVFLMNIVDDDLKDLISVYPLRKQSQINQCKGLINMFEHNGWIRIFASKREKTDSTDFSGICFTSQSYEILVDDDESSIGEFVTFIIYWTNDCFARASEKKILFGFRILFYARRFGI